MDQCEDVMQFVRNEVVRLSKRRSATPQGSPDFKELLSELVWTLPLNEKREVIPCGQKARETIVELLSYEFWSSDCCDAISYDKFIDRALCKFTCDFLFGGLDFNTASMKQMVKDCLETFRAECHDSLHFIPCSLFMKQGSTNLDFGDICFFNKENFWRFVDRLSSDDACLDELHDIERNVIEWYKSFNWIAAVWVRNCTDERLRHRAECAANLAINIISLNFHHSQAGKMYSAASSRWESETMAHYWWRSEVGFGYQYGMQATASLADGEKWYRKLAGDEPMSLLDAAKNLISMYVDASVRYPLVNRLVESLNWCGAGMREVSPGSSIAKLITSLECLVMTGNGGNVQEASRFKRKRRGERKVKETVINRSVGLYGISYIDPDLERVRRVVGRGYALRSDVLHGSTSSQDPLLYHEVSAISEVVASVIRGTMVLWNRRNLFDKAVNNYELDTMFDIITKMSGTYNDREENNDLV